MRQESLFHMYKKNTLNSAILYIFSSLYCLVIKSCFLDIDSIFQINNLYKMNYNYFQIIILTYSQNIIHFSCHIHICNKQKLVYLNDLKNIYCNHLNFLSINICNYHKPAIVHQPLKIIFKICLHNKYNN